MTEYSFSTFLSQSSDGRRQSWIRWTGIYIGLTMLGGLLTQTLYCLPMSSHFDPMQLGNIPQLQISNRSPLRSRHANCRHPLFRIQRHYRRSAYAPLSLGTNQ